MPGHLQVGCRMPPPAEDIIQQFTHSYLHAGHVERDEIEGLLARIAHLDDFACAAEVIKEITRPEGRRQPWRCPSPTTRIPKTERILSAFHVPPSHAGTCGYGARGSGRRVAGSSLAA